MNRIILCFFITFSVQAKNFEEIFQKYALENVSLKKMTPKESDNVLVVFWGTWCLECKDKLENKLPAWEKNEDLSVVTINMDTNLKRGLHYLKKKKISLPVYVNKDKKIFKDYNVSAVPHWILFKKGEMVASERSFDDQKILSFLK